MPELSSLGEPLLCPGASVAQGKGHSYPGAAFLSPSTLVVILVSLCA